MGIQQMPAAAARIGGEPGIRGIVRFYPRMGGTIVEADIRGLPETKSGFFALHIHQTGDCGGAGFPGTGGHYDPEQRPHPRHAGDLPPLLSCAGRAYMRVMTNRFRIRDVVGRSVVIHKGPDDFTTQPAGNAGEKIACGVISWVSLGQT